MTETPLFQVGDLIRHKLWGTAIYTVIATTSNGALIVRTTDHRPFTRSIKPVDFGDYEKVHNEQPNL